MRCGSVRRDRKRRLSVSQRHRRRARQRLRPGQPISNRLTVRSGGWLPGPRIPDRDTDATAIAIATTSSEKRPERHAARRRHDANRRGFDAPASSISIRASAMSCSRRQDPSRGIGAAAHAARGGVVRAARSRSALWPRTAARVSDTSHREMPAARSASRRGRNRTPRCRCACPTGFPRACSGLMYAAVPKITPA